MQLTAITQKEAKVACKKTKSLISMMETIIDGNDSCSKLKDTTYKIILLALNPNQFLLIIVIISYNNYNIFFFIPTNELQYNYQHSMNG